MAFSRIPVVYSCFLAWCMGRRDVGALSRCLGVSNSHRASGLPFSAHGDFFTSFLFWDEPDSRQQVSLSLNERRTAAVSHHVSVAYFFAFRPYPPLLVTRVYGTAHYSSHRHDCVAQQSGRLPIRPVYVPAQHIGTIGNRVTIQMSTTALESSSRAKRFHRQYKDQLHCSTGTIGSPPLDTLA